MTAQHVDIAIVGTGFSGLGMAIRLKKAGIDDFTVLERADEVGGTWRDNTYPGCQCDIPSNLYSFSFEPNPNWTRTYPLQEEIWDYLRHCSKKYGIDPHIRFGHEVTGAEWDEAAGLWRIETAAGELTARVLIAGVGGLSEPRIPEIPGLEQFEGPLFHSADWQHDHSLRGKRVAVVGTGASAIQLIPRIQPEVERLTVFQRTPPWITPHSDRPTTRLERRLFKRFPGLQRAVRRRMYWLRELLVFGFAKNMRLMRPIEKLARRHLAAQVRDPELRRKLTPDYRIGCKRILVSNDYYPALTQPNVELVTGGITEIRANSVVAADGSEHEVDAIVMATGFFVTDIPAAKFIRGRAGRTLAEAWNGSMQAYLGTNVAGYPNLFFLTGPNTGLGHNSMVVMIEAQIAYVMDALRVMRDHSVHAVDVLPEVQRRYNEGLQDQLRSSVWNVGGCASWYLDANGRNTTIWPDFTWRFRKATRRFEPANYALLDGERASGIEPQRAAA